MARAAGNKPHYTWLLLDENTGKVIRDVSLELPSVTSIIGRVLAKDLTGWAYWSTLDSVTGLYDAISATDRKDVMVDSSELDAALRTNRMRPQDIARGRADEGQATHAYLERLAGVQLADDEGTADRKMAQRTLAKSEDGYERAVASFWLEVEPEVISAEQKVWSLYEGGFQGTLDLAYRDPTGFTIIADLKTRKLKGTAYSSDHVQVGAYEIAYEERTGQAVHHREVLVARPDGTYVLERSSRDDPAIFLRLLEIDQLLRKGV